MENFNYEKELSKCKTLEDITGKNGLVQRIVKNAIESILQKEFNEHIENTSTYRNGYTNKKVKTEYGDVEIKVPRDRESKFVPEIIEKRQTTSNGIKDQITSMYAKGMSTRDISDHIEALYGTTLSANTISTITDDSLEKGKEWFNRNLDKVYPIVFMDAVHFKVKEEHKIVNKAAYIALGINLEGQKEVLGVCVNVNINMHIFYNLIM